MMTPSEIDELERLMTAATPGRWSEHEDVSRSIVASSEPNVNLLALFTPPDDISYAVVGSKDDHAAIVALHNAAPALIAAARDLAWHEDRHGTRAEQEAEDAVLDADLARIDSLSDEECIAELAAEGIDYDAARKKFDAMLKVCAERSDLRREVDRLRAFVPRWERQQSCCYRLLCGKTVLAAIEIYDDDSAAWWMGDWFTGRTMRDANIESAARAVCTRLDIPYVPVDVDDG